MGLAQGQPLPRHASRRTAFHPVSAMGQQAHPTIPPHIRTPTRTNDTNKYHHHHQNRYPTPTSLHFTPPLPTQTLSHPSPPITTHHHPSHPSPPISTPGLLRRRKDLRSLLRVLLATICREPSRCLLPRPHGTTRPVGDEGGRGFQSSGCGREACVSRQCVRGLWRRLNVRSNQLWITVARPFGWLGAVTCQGDATHTRDTGQRRG